MASEDEADLKRLRQAVAGLGKDARLTEVVDLVTAQVARWHRREQWLHAAHDINETLLTGTNPLGTLRLVALRARELTHAPVAAIALPDPERPGNLSFDVIEGTGPVSPKLLGVSRPIDGTGSGKVFRTGRAEIFSDYGRHIAEIWDHAEREMPPGVLGLDSMLAVPLAFGGEIQGVLIIARLIGDEPFGDVEMNLAESFATKATLALEIGRSEEDRRRLAVLRDRDRIARDLHDVVVQRLFAIGIGLQGMGKGVSSGSLAGMDLENQIAELGVEVDRTIRDIRCTIFELQEADENPDGLRAELAGTAEAQSAALGFRPRVEFDGPIDSLVPDPVRPDLLASLREALSNVARHAIATSASVSVTVDRSGTLLTLVVTDDGIGLPETVRRRSGLANLDARARRWGGEFRLERPDGGGTRLRWSVPLSGESLAGESPAEGTA